MFGSKHVALKELRSINYYMCLLPAHLLSLRATLNASGYCNADILSLSLFILIHNHLYIYTIATFPMPLPIPNPMVPLVMV